MADSQSMASPAIAAPATVRAAASKRSRLPIVFWVWKVTYALAAGAFCVFWLSFFPAPGKPLQSYLPSNAAVVLHIHSGEDLLRFLNENPSVQELLKDEDVEHFAMLQEQIASLKEKYSTAPRIVRRLYPPAEGTIPVSQEALSPVGGDEVLVARLTPPGHDSRKPGILLLTRLRGARGMLIRLAAWWAENHSRARGNLHTFDLGGDVLAAGLNGAQPKVIPEASAEPLPSFNPEALASVYVYPSRLAVARGDSDAGLLECPQMQELSGERIPPPVLEALLKPPRSPEILNFPDAPKVVSVDLFRNGDGFSARGSVMGKLPSLPESVRPLPVPVEEEGGEPPVVHAEGLLPFDAQSAFLAYIESAMRLRRDATRLTRSQFKWSQRFGKLYDAGVELDKDLWPAIGNTLLFSIQQAPLDRSASGYDLIFASAGFKSDDEIAREAAAELARVRWDYLFDGTPTQKAPYVRRVRDGGSETFILATGKITAPTWQIGNGELLVTSDSGPHAIVNPASVASALQSAKRGTPIHPDRFFINLNGPKLASTVQQIITAEFDATEEDLGPTEFLKRVPDAQARIRLAGKLTRLLGEFHAELKPGAAKDAAGEIRIEWKPASLVAPQEVEDVAPPPPPPAP